MPNTVKHGAIWSGDDKIAKSLGLRPLEEFVSYSPEDALAMMEDMGDDPAELDGLELPEQTWYESPGRIGLGE